MVPEPAQNSLFLICTSNKYAKIKKNTFDSENGILLVGCNLIFSFIAIGIKFVFLGFILKIRCQDIQTTLKDVTEEGP